MLNVLPLHTPAILTHIDAKLVLNEVIPYECYVLSKIKLGACFKRAKFGKQKRYNCQRSGISMLRTWPLN